MFKEDFKYYKSKKPPPDLSNVLNFNCEDSIKSRVRQIQRNETEADNLPGLKPVQQWEAYELIDNPGLIFIRNPFTSLGQKYWIIRCLRDYTRRPNKLNLDIHGTIPEDGDWWQMSRSGENQNISAKLRWATLGYHHNWDTKVYSEDSKSIFPSDLARLCKYVANILGYKHFNAEAAIINYYHMDSTLSGHTDHSEQFLEAPLFSFSLGQSAIFLLGGQTVSVKPTAMFLHSGDIVVMSKESRVCYHGVPKIIPAPETPWESNILYDDNKTIDAKHLPYDIVTECNDETYWAPFAKYVEGSRININVRQVLRRGQTRLSDQ